MAFVIASVNVIAPLHVDGTVPAPAFAVSIGNDACEVSLQGGSQIR